jgi:hypothetical protein
MVRKSFLNNGRYLHNVALVTLVTGSITGDILSVHPGKEEKAAIASITALTRANIFIMAY